MREVGEFHKGPSESSALFWRHEVKASLKQAGKGGQIEDRRGIEGSSRTSVIGEMGKDCWVAPRACPRVGGQEFQESPGTATLRCRGAGVEQAVTFHENSTCIISSILMTGLRSLVYPFDRQVN